MRHFFYCYEGQIIVQKSSFFLSYTVQRRRATLLSQRTSLLDIKRDASYTQLYVEVETSRDNASSVRAEVQMDPSF